MTSPDAWLPSTTKPPTESVSTWQEDERRSVQVLCRVKRGDEVNYFIAQLQHWPDTTPQWRTTCSESWDITYPFEWKYIVEEVPDAVT